MKAEDQKSPSSVGKDALTKEEGLRAEVEGYLEAIKNKDLDRCLSFFADEATIQFQSGVFQGKQALEEWHKARFDANLRVVRVEKIEVQEDRVVVHAVVTSDRLKAWRISSLSGKAVFHFQDGRIRRSEFGLRVSSPLEGW